MFLDKPLFKADFNVNIFNNGVKCSLLLIISTILTQRLKSTIFWVCNGKLEKWGIITFIKSLIYLQ